MNKNNYKSKGMTLAEVLVSIAIFTVVMLVVADFQYNIFSYKSSVTGSLETAQGAQSILRTMSKELRTMSPGGNGAYPIISASTSTVSFFSDIEGNGSVEQVRYFLSGTSLKKGVIAPSGTPTVYTATEKISTLADNVKNSTSSPIFEYFDGNYTGTGSALVQPVTPTSVRLIKINLTLDVDPKRSPLPVTYTSQVTLRNIKDNL